MNTILLTNRESTLDAIEEVLGKDARLIASEVKGENLAFFSNKDLPELLEVLIDEDFLGTQVFKEGEYIFNYDSFTRVSSDFLDFNNEELNFNLLSEVVEPDFKTNSVLIENRGGTVYFVGSVDSNGLNTLLADGEIELALD